MWDAKLDVTLVETQDTNSVSSALYSLSSCNGTSGAVEFTTGAGVTCPITGIGVSKATIDAGVLSFITRAGAVKLTTGAGVMYSFSEEGAAWAEAGEDDTFSTTGAGSPNVAV